MTRRVAEGDAYVRSEIGRLGADADTGHGCIGKTLGASSGWGASGRPWRSGPASFTYVSSIPRTRRLSERAVSLRTRTLPDLLKEADFVSVHVPLTRPPIT